MSEQLKIRIHGAAPQPTLIYLPGLHGDWTLVGGFRKCLSDRVRFVEFTYPRTLEWSLDDYAAAIEKALLENGITEGWLLGESFGSQILWALVQRKNFSTTGIILAGGFVKHPLRWAVRLAETVFSRLPFTVMVWAMYAFTKYARRRFHRSPATLADIDEFVARRTKLDAQAATHRLHLIAENDPRPVARETKLPVYFLSGLIDPIVPWPFVKHWLKCHCPALRACKIIPAADHNVLGTASEESAETVFLWLKT